MSWSFTFQGVREDAEAALDNVTVPDGPGKQDQWNRIKPLILQELQAMNPGQVVVKCNGTFHGSNPNYRSVFSINVQNAVVLNNGILSPPNQPASSMLNG